MSIIFISLAIASISIAAVTAKTPEQYFDNAVYTSWLSSNGKNYSKSLFLNTSDDSTGVGIFWTIDKTEEDINLAVVCPTGDGWCAFGIAEAGAMLGSDMVIFESESNSLYDAHVLDDINGGPIRDLCQNWKLINSVASGDESNGVIVFEAQRSLDTGDSFDRAIVDDSDGLIPPTRVITAWLNTPTVSFHGKNVARSSIRFFATGESDDEVFFQQSMEEHAMGSFELRAKEYPVPETETYYALFCFTYSDLVGMGVPVDEDLHVIGIEPIVDEDAKEFVHHFIVSATLDPLQNYTSPIPEETCNELPIVENAYTWAPGEGPFVFPDYLGSPLGSNGYKSYTLEIHYNNPSLKTGKFDSSGIRMYWTSKKRENDMGILQLGDPYLSLMDQMVGSGLSHHTFECPGSCSKVSVMEPITVIREYMHMHKTGTRMYNEQVRDGQVIRTGSFDYWDFDQLGDAPVQQGSFQILPGDSFRTRCYFSANNEVWGLGSQQEMCISFLYYYPRQVLDLDGTPFPYTCGANFDFFPECNSVYANMTIRSTEEMERSFGSANGVCNVPIDDSVDDPFKNDTKDQSSAGSKSYVLVALLVAFAALTI